MVKTIVTGASGHIGFHVARELLNRNYQVLVLSRSINDNIRILQAKGATLHQCDLLNPESYKDKLTGYEVFFHIASLNTTNTKDRAYVIEGTYELTKTVLDCALKSGIKTIIYTSSVVVLGRSKQRNNLVDLTWKTNSPESPYVEGKILAENYCEKLIANGCDIRRLYPSWVLGDHDINDTPPHKFIRNLIANGSMFYFNGGVSLSAVEEVAKAHVLAMEKGEQSSRYLLGGNNISFYDFYKKVADFSGHTPPKILIPKFFIYIGSILLKMVTNLVNRDTIIDPKYVQAVIGRYSWYDSSNTVRDLNYNIPNGDQLLESTVIQQMQKMTGLSHFSGFPRLKKVPGAPTILITGFPGWLGNRLVDIILNRRYESVDNINFKLLVHSKFKSLIPDDFPIEVIEGDLTNKDSLMNALHGIDKVFHIAGSIYPKKIKTLYAVNYQGTKNLVDACIEQGIKRIVYIGTDSICGKGNKKQRIFDENTAPKPYRNYGKSKYLAEKYILEKTNEGFIEGTSLRAFWFFGPFAPERQKNFVKMFYWPRQIVFGNGLNFRSITHVDNLIHAMFLAANNPVTVGQWYWIGDSKPDRTVDEIYSSISKTLDISYKPLYIPVWMCKLINFGDLLLSKMGILNSTIHAAGKFYFDIAGEINKAREDFGYYPIVSFDKLLEEIKEIKID